ncbi:unnamed protein product [Staurois parvus]|uniref:Uncharacterized protein n=1 Tax=Staurois parvus TaxID=386267 RepID=A0ABN9DKW5_9NEOB|nr:unnamed protein product [Staurois parvus]
MGPPGNRGSWGPMSLPTLKPHPKKPIKKVQGASHGAPHRPRALRAVPEFPNGQSAPGPEICSESVTRGQSSTDHQHKGSKVPLITSTRGQSSTDHQHKGAKFH